MAVHGRGLVLPSDDRRAAGSSADRHDVGGEYLAVRDGIFAKQSTRAEGCDDRDFQPTTGLGAIQVAIDPATRPIDLARPWAHVPLASAQGWCCWSGRGQNGSCG